MPSKTSSSKGLFSPALFRNDLSRFWPLWALYLAAWLLSMPAVQLLGLFGHNRQWMDPADLHTSALYGVTEMASSGALMISVAFGCLFAMALFSYLTNARAVGFVHALPARRGGLFLTHYISGAAVFLTVHAVTALLTMAVWTAAGMQEIWLIGIWFLSATGQMLFFYSFAAFCAMFAGQLLAIPVFYGVLNGLAYGLTYLIQSLCEMLFYGWSYSDFPLAVGWLTPVYKLSGLFWNLWTYDEQGHWSGADWGEFQSGLGVVGIYALAGVGLTAAALAVYSRRRSESTGDTVAISWARPLFRYGVGICAALSVGQLLYTILRDAFDQGDASVPALAACMVVLGLVGYFAAEMLLQKSFRVLKRGWKGGAALAAVLVLLCVAFSVDLLGIEKYVPAADDVQSLNFGINGVNYISGTVTDPETIERFLSLHQAVVKEQPENDWSSENASYAGLRLNYILKNGKGLSRYYDFTYVSGEEQKDGSVLSQLAALMSDPAVRRADLSAQFLDAVDRLTAAETTLYQLQPDGKSEMLNFDADTAQMLLDALEKDIDAGHLGEDALDEEAWYANTYANRLTFYYRVKTDPASPQEDNSASFDLGFSKNDTYLLAALERAGVDTGLLTTCKQMDNFDGSTELTGEAYTYAQAEGRIPDDVGSVEFEDPTSDVSASIIGGAASPTGIYVASQASPADTQEP
jgi:ABC-2 type transport system permease protein